MQPQETAHPPGLVSQSLAQGMWPASSQNPESDLAHGAGLKARVNLSELPLEIHLLRWGLLVSVLTAAALAVLQTQTSL